MMIKNNKTTEIMQVTVVTIIITLSINLRKVMILTSIRRIMLTINLLRVMKVKNLIKRVKKN